MSEKTPSPAAEETAAATADAAAAEAAATGRRRKKRKVSRELKGVQRWERRASKATHRLARAVEEGVATYRRERDRSAGRKRDGALRDLPLNVAEGMAATAREASRISVDLVKGLDGRLLVRIARSGARLVLSPFLR